ncbi:unnamed protein product [Closterium sp. Yama58-4]|nr:unnamed protein product [Closterium sp. Yama58-4]
MAPTDAPAQSKGREASVPNEAGGPSTTPESKKRTAPVWNVFELELVFKTLKSAFLVALTLTRRFGVVWCVFSPKVNVPSRVTIARDIMDAYKDFFSKLKVRLGALSSKISFTCDLWTAPNNEQFMAITAHWIDKNWEIYKEWGLEEKVMGITVDNASNNEKFLSLLSTEVGFCKDRHLMCFAHVLNLIAECILKTPRVDRALTKIRGLATHLSGSTKRTKTFLAHCKADKETGKKTSLIHDTPTRWNSAYAMIDRAKAYGLFGCWGAKRE